MEEHTRIEVSANRRSGLEGNDALADHNPSSDKDRADGLMQGNAIGDEFAARPPVGRIDNAASNPDGDPRRSGGSPNDPDGGHELIGREWRTPDPDPIHELVPGGQGAEPPPYSADELMARARNQPVFGRLAGAPALGRGNAELGVDPRKFTPSVDPTSEAARKREGIHETGGGYFPSDDAAPNGRHGSLNAGDAEQLTASLAYTASQKPNLPPAGSIAAAAPADAKGASLSEQPVEGRDNTMVFNQDTGNFELKEEIHETGVSPHRQSSRL